MKYMGVRSDGTVAVSLTAEECDLLSHWVADGDVGKDRSEQSIAACLADDFRALGRVLQMNQED